MGKKLGVWVGLLLLPLAVGRAEAATITVCASGCAYANLQAAIDAAAFGDVILLRAGETYVGHFVLRAKSGTGWIEIRSNGDPARLPAAGQRLVPSDRGGATPRSLLARIVGRGGSGYRSTPLLRTEPGAHGYILRFLEFDGVAQEGYETLIQIGTDTTATPPYDITFDRVYVHGHPHKGQKRGIAVNARRISVLNSYISDIKSMSADSQAIAGWNGAGPFTIENNYLEAAGENVMFGGGAPAIANLVPADITIRHNHFFKPTSWRNAIVATPGNVRAVAGSGGSLGAGTHYFRVVARMKTSSSTASSLPSAAVSATVSAGGSVTVSWSAVPGADHYYVYRGTSATSQTRFMQTTGTSLVYTGSGEASGTPTTYASKWVVKNLFELKNAERVTVEGNIFENSWMGSQAGYAIMLTPRNSGGKAPWSRVQDVTFTNNIVRHVAGVVNVLGFDDENPSQRAERIAFRNNLFYDVSHTKYGSGAKAILLGQGASEIVFDHNTIIHTNTSVVFAYGDPMPGFVYTNNISQHHTYGISGDNSAPGTRAINDYFPGGVVRCNVLAGGKASSYPSPNAFPTVAEWTASFVDYAGGNYALRPGSPVATAGCNGVVPGADIAAVNRAVGGGSSPGSGAPGAPTNVRIVR